MTQETPYAKAVHRMEQAAAAGAQVQTQLPFMADDPKDTGDMRVVDATRAEDAAGIPLGTQLGIPIELQRVLLIWVLKSANSDRVSAMTDTEVRRHLNVYLARTVASLSLSDLRV